MGLTTPPNKETFLPETNSRDQAICAGCRQTTVASFGGGLVCITALILTQSLNSLGPEFTEK